MSRDMERFESLQGAVRHLKYGDGRVLSVTPFEGGSLILVRFHNPFSRRVTYVIGKEEAGQMSVVKDYTGADSANRAWADFSGA